ncbi:hypothetical protein LshimejAT787_1302230 [Lyophyllum shimeji]|uniref:Uncharacterized protein n=1 Tax=Lyophyllum shimeji TaxID=47721 RepID=A0A9P3PY11_LYOSH|nr:hypothetical protein LshimejAT787_1302230 [Lyophyllum shimeji]
MSSPAVTQAANYLKIAGASIFAFDYFQTLPAEIRFYRKQKSIFRLSIACWLLISVRYLGMAAIVLSLVGGFSTSFTHQSCDRFFLSVPVLKVLAAVASQGVFIFRTYAICNRSKTILYFLLVFGGSLSAAEIIAPVVVPRNAKLGPTHNCISDLSKGTTSWIQYMCQVIFDVVILGLTSDRLFRGVDMKFVTRSEFTKIFWESQIMYFIAVTIVNIVNLVFFIKFSHSSESTMFATLGMAVTAIFSSHVILDLHEVANGPRSYSTSRSNGQIPNHATGIHTTTYRSGEIGDRQLRVMTGDETKTDSYRMTDIEFLPPSRQEISGVHIQREVVAKVDDSDETSVSSWERRQADLKKSPI